MQGDGITTARLRDHARFTMGYYPTEDAILDFIAQENGCSSIQKMRGDLNLGGKIEAMTAMVGCRSSLMPISDWMTSSPSESDCGSIVQWLNVLASAGHQKDAAGCATTPLKAGEDRNSAPLQVHPRGFLCANEWVELDSCPGDWAVRMENVCRPSWCGPSSPSPSH